jgi:hypothetical protein
MTRIPNTRSSLLDSDPLAEVIEIMGGYDKVVDVEVGEAVAPIAAATNDGSNPPASSRRPQGSRQP